jgi:hypothetical protein
MARLQRFTDLDRTQTKQADFDRAFTGNAKFDRPLLRPSPAPAFIIPQQTLANEIPEKV